MKQYTVISFYPNFCKDPSMTFAVWTYLKFSTPVCLPSRCLTISITSTPHHICGELIRDAPFGVSRSAHAPALAHLTQREDSHEDLVHMVSWINALCHRGHGNVPCLGQTLPSQTV